MTNGVSAAARAAETNTCASVLGSQPLERRGRRAEQPLERAPHALGISESAVVGDLLHRPCAAIEQRPGRIGPQTLHGFGRSDADLVVKGAGEIARAHAGAGCELLHSELTAEVAAHVFEQRREAPATALE